MLNTQSAEKITGGGSRDKAERLARTLLGIKIDGDLLVTLDNGDDYFSYSLRSAL